MPASHLGSGASMWVIPTDEERMIAEHTLEVVTRPSGPLARCRERDRTPRGDDEGRTDR